MLLLRVFPSLKDVPTQPKEGRVAIGMASGHQAASIDAREILSVSALIYSTRTNSKSLQLARRNIQY